MNYTHFPFTDYRVSDYWIFLYYDYRSLRRFLREAYDQQWTSIGWNNADGDKYQSNGISAKISWSSRSISKVAIGSTEYLFLYKMKMLADRYVAQNITP